MRIDFHKRFKKQYRKLPQNIRTKVDSTLRQFRQDPFQPKLRNHALTGSMKGKRSISVTGDMRIIFEEFDDYTVVIMLRVGNHGRLYK